MSESIDLEEVADATVNAVAEVLPEQSERKLA